jgi:hypothetical protein
MHACGGKANLVATSRKSRSNSRNEKGLRSSSSRGQGEYYHAEVRPGEDFVSYLTQDVGDPGRGPRSSG